MSSDGPGADPQGSAEASAAADGQVQNQLVEALIHVLIEKGVLTRNDALSIVQTVADVQQGMAADGKASGAQIEAVEMLHRLYASFEALADRSGTLIAGGANVHQLRPPIYDRRPGFSRDD